MSGKTKVAILGGGVGAMTAAFALSDTPELRDRFELTVYQKGWRLGGKGASGRNARVAQRIEEHGLHVWMGFYENAFRVMRACYAELGRAPGEPLATWEEAFRQQSYVVIEEQIAGRPHDGWTAWNFDFPTNSEKPGDGGALPSLWTCLEMVVEWLFGHDVELAKFNPVTRLFAPDDASRERGISPDDAPEPPAEPCIDVQSAPDWVKAIVAVAGLKCDPIDKGPGIGTLVKEHAEAPADSSGDEPLEAPPNYGRSSFSRPSFAPDSADDTRGPTRGLELDDLLVDPFGTLLDHLKDARAIVRGLPDDPRLHTAAQHQAACWLIRSFVDGAWAVLGPLVDRDFEAYKLWVEINLAGAIAIGFLSDGVLFGGWSVIDHMDLRQWLGLHGANEVTLRSGLIRGIYDLVFGYVGGDRDRPALAAGTAVRGMLRMTLTYKGSIFWEMQAGMGDAIFAPLYRVLARRGVRFEFFHEVTGLDLSADRQAVETLIMNRQVKLASDRYDPLVVVRGLESWPSEPIYAQIEGGDELSASGIDLESSWAPAWRDEAPIRLQRGVDFDQVVLGISLAALAPICPALAAANPRFATMLERLGTVQTCALQLWLSPDLAWFGWRAPPGVHETPVMTGYVDPLDTWADMTHLLPREAWPPGNEPRTLAYFCGSFPDAAPIPPFWDHGFPAREKARFESIAVSFLNRDVGRLFPAAAYGPGGGFRWELLVDLEGRAGEARLASQYARVNVEPTERYVLSLPGTTTARLRPDDSGFANLYLAGDWTYSNLNAGCVEAATMSGLWAARALSGVYRPILGESDL